MTEELRTLLQVCRMCDLIYGAADVYYGVGQTVFGVTITPETTVAELVDAALKEGK